MGSKNIKVVVQVHDLLRAVVSENVGQRLVGEQDIEVPVDADALRRSFDQVAEALLAVAQGLLGALARGDVAYDSSE